MPKVEIDTDVLSALAQNLSQAAGLLNQVIASPSKPDTPRKRGRPKKVEQIVSEKKIESIPVLEEDIKAALAEEAPLPEHRKPLPANVIAAKRLGNNIGVHTVNKSEPVNKRDQPQRFIDLESVGDRIPSYKYPQPTERRPPAKEFEFTCSRCHRNFKGSPKEYAQAFMVQEVDNIKGSPLVKCKDCETLPV